MEKICHWYLVTKAGRILHLQPLTSHLKNNNTDNHYPKLRLNYFGLSYNFGLSYKQERFFCD